MDAEIDTGEDTELLAQEQWDESVRPIVESRTVFVTPQDVARFLLFEPGRFRSPLSFLEKIKLRLFARSAWLDFFHLSGLFYHAWNVSRIGASYPWQILLQYLCRHGVIQNADISIGKLGHDAVKTPMISLYALGSDKKLGGFSNVSDSEVALSKSIGELLERRFLFLRYRGGLGSKRYTCHELEERGLAFVHPGRLSQFSPEQIRRLPSLQFDAATPFFWVQGKDIFSESEVLLPEQVVFLAGKTARESSSTVPEPILRESNTNGSAGHFSYEEAVLSGIYESVERDSFLLFWLSNIAPPRVDVSGVESVEFQDLMQRVSRYRFEACFLNTTTDIGIPSCVCVLIDRSPGGPRVALGGGCGWDAEKILLSSLYEALSVENWSASFSIPPALGDDYVPFSDASWGRKQRILLWRNPEMFSKISPFLSGPRQDFREAFPKRFFRDTSDEYRQTLDIFRAHGEGYPVFVYERHHPLLEKIGFHVVKVIIPKLLHLHLNETLAPLGAERLREMLEKRGYTAIKDENFNPWPHPFP